MTVNSVGSAGRDFSTWQAWEDAFAATLTAPQEGEGYIDNGTWFKTAAATLTFAGVTTSGTNFVEARPATGQGFATGIGAAGPLRLDFTKGVGMECSNTYIQAVLIQYDFVRLRGLQINAASGVDSYPLIQDSSTFGGVLIRDCILNAPTSNGGPVAKIVSGTMENVLAIQRGGGNGIAFGYAGGGAGVTLTNCTIVRPSDITAANSALYHDTGTLAIVNCAGFGFTNFSNDATFSGSNNASDVAISFGSANQASKTYANQFQNALAASADFRAKAGGDLPANATSTGAPSADIIGQAFTNTIGAWQLQTATSAFVPSLFSDGPGQRPTARVGY